MSVIKQFLVTCIVFFAIDILWLAVVAKKIIPKTSWLYNDR